MTAPRLSRWTWVALGAALAIVVVIPLAIVDHNRKNDRIAAAPAAVTACTHFGKRCDEEQPDEIEARWTERKRIYKGALVLFALVGGGAFAASLRRHL
ncbi:MAG: hypothetical protein QOE13_2485 [Gaiellaceae bacterium]|jgi:hypothetical protein|nr:hypothetical protein [Gaiellaceae bacterium]